MPTFCYTIYRSYLDLNLIGYKTPVCQKAVGRPNHDSVYKEDVKATVNPYERLLRAVNPYERLLRAVNPYERLLRAVNLYKRQLGAVNQRREKHRHL